MAASSTAPTTPIEPAGTEGVVDPELARDRAERRAEANQMLGMGAGIGVFGVASWITFGAVCPACVIATPALLGAGLYRRLRARDRRGGDSEE